jgi:DtxR family Mn-dependent transcriptional regulator
VRHHRLLELYLTRVVGFGWDEVHDQADALEHAISEEFEERIDAILGCPTADPHGDPIPTKEGRMPRSALIPLVAIEPDPEQHYVIARVLTQAPDLLRYLDHCQCVPGTHLRLLDREPFGGPLHLLVQTATDEIERQISPHIATIVLVAPT